MKTEIDYWFTIEPYVFINIANKSVLLYNTLDGVTMESDKEEVIELLNEIVNVENCGVVLLTHERFNQKDVNGFIHVLREKFMGDIIDINLSKVKPVQLLPYFNFPEKQEIYKKHNFSPLKNVLDNLSEISIHTDVSTSVANLITFLHSVHSNPTFNIIGNLYEVSDYKEILSFFDQRTSPKNVICSYKNVVAIQPVFENNFSYRILVHFPIDMQTWDSSRKVLLEQEIPIEYIFEVSSNEECLQAEKIIEQFQIETYRMSPVYIGNNIQFFEENVFLSKNDILSKQITIKDFFMRQALNIYDFGKINIMPNGDAYANINHPALGNIYTNSIQEIINKEIEEGKSWFRIRNQAPCNDCVYQWLCPSPSNYEIQIGRPNLCHLK